MYWFIIIILTGGAQVSANITTDIIFDTEKLCGEYIVQNYDKLKAPTNKKYNQHLSTPNLYRCVIGLP